MDLSIAFSSAKKFLSTNGFNIVEEDNSRPWGGYLVIDDSQTIEFISTYFPKGTIPAINTFQKLSPKLLIVGPGKRLSWQYHLRRAEIWRCVEGQVGVITSYDDDEGPLHLLKTGEMISLKQGERHRLVGLDDYGIVAEIWMHTDKNNPSDEDDVIRIQDDFNR